ncbi:response regulator [Lignipirellula cremea]|uniref:response regulator n=1 Tax=Lignipirellula cremea TaxID=2528010 RepID=UPI0011A0B50B|nr:response regulator [Lignipirellula cremea]
MEDCTHPATPSIQATHGQETLLLVEDEKPVRKIVKTMLQREGYKVLEAAAGEEAIELAQSFPGKIQILLTDVVMPGMRNAEKKLRYFSRQEPRNLSSPSRLIP